MSPGMWKGTVVVTTDTGKESASGGERGVPNSAALSSASHVAESDTMEVETGTAPAGAQTLAVRPIAAVGRRREVDGEVYGQGRVLHHSHEAVGGRWPPITSSPRGGSRRRSEPGATGKRRRGIESPKKLKESEAGVRADTISAPPHSDAGPEVPVAHASQLDEAFASGSQSPVSAESGTRCHDELAAEIVQTVSEILRHDAGLLNQKFRIMPEGSLADLARGLVERLVTLQPIDIFAIVARFHDFALFGMANKHFPSYDKFRAFTPAEFGSDQHGLLNLVSKTVAVWLRHTASAHVPNNGYPGLSAHWEPVFADGFCGLVSVTQMQSCLNF